MVCECFCSQLINWWNDLPQHHCKLRNCCSLEKVILTPSYYGHDITLEGRNNEKVVAPVKFPEIFNIYASFKFDIANVRGLV